MDTKQIQKQVAVATIQAEGSRCLYSDLGSNHWVHNGQGLMSQQEFAERQAKRIARGY